MAYRNIIDDSSTTVSAATPGWTVDLRNHTTHRLRGVGVPVRFKVCVNSTAANDTGAIKLVDSTGSTVLTCLVNNPAATTSPIGDWYWVDGYVPATLAKYDVHYGGNTIGSLTPFSASLYEIDWTTDPVTGSMSATLGAFTVSATVPFSGDMTTTLGALTVSSTGTVEVKGDSAMTLGAMTLAATGTVAAPAAPTYQAIGSHATNTSGGGASPAWPTHAVDDYAILLVIQANGGASSDPGAATLSVAAGFTAVTSGSKLSSSTGGGFSPVATRITAFECRATSTSMSTPTVNGISGCTINTVIITFRGCTTSGSAVDVVASAANNGTDTSLVATGGTTTADARVVLVASGGIANGGGTGTASGWTNAALISITERFDSSTNATLSGATGTKATAGAVGNTTATWSSGICWASLMIALKP